MTKSPLVRLALFPGIRQALARLYDSNFPGAYALHIARTKHVDALVERELAAGASQLVTLGAAFDTRSYRFANWLAKAAVFEVDYAATLECKSRRLRTAATRGPALQRIALDMNEAEFAAPLRAAGYDPRRRTVFVWEGITPYLSRRHIESVLAMVATAAPGSALIFDYVLECALHPDTSLYGAREAARYARRKGEPYLCGFDPDALRPMVFARGLHLERNALAFDLEQACFGDIPRSNRLRLPEHVGIALARVPGAPEPATEGADVRGRLQAPVGSRRTMRGPASALMTTLRYVVDPFKAYPHFQSLYGDPFCAPTLQGTLVITGQPDGARDILTADPETFDVFGPKSLGAIFGPMSVMMLAGSRHHRERRLLNPPFHRERLRSYADIMQRAAIRRIAQWKLGQSCAMQQTAKTISRDIIIRAVFGIVSDAFFEEFRDRLNRHSVAARPSVIFFERLRGSLFSCGRWSRLQDATRELDELIYREIARRRRAATDSPDILGMLLAARYEDGQAMTDEAIRDELMGLTLAGYVTTAISTSWTLYWLHRDPAKLQQLRAELSGVALDAPEQLAKLPYLEAVCHEALRLYPLIPDVFRLLRRPLRIRGRLVPAGFGVAVSMVLLHRRAETFEAPEEFRPERFLERKYSPFEYMPFGGGSRRCLGAAFALYEMKIVVGTILQHIELALVGEERPARQGLAMGPRRGVRLRPVRWLVPQLDRDSLTRST